MNPTLPARIERLERLVWLLQALYKSRTHVELEFARSRLHAELDAPPKFLPAPSGSCAPFVISPLPNPGG